MRTQLNTVADAFRNRVVKHSWVACVKTTGDVGCGDQIKQCFVGSDRVVAETLTEIRYYSNLVDSHGGRS
ncbi:hypothetical protein SDC9_180480 [bioreactor metagenome]|uniref:Uncharacterized protein n=1 Tax=bioreactor metagenome TaxID=1076179 RepID=A0A645H1T9_9ZZZZ